MVTKKSLQSVQQPRGARRLKHHKALPLPQTLTMTQSANRTTGRRVKTLLQHHTTASAVAVVTVCPILLPLLYFLITTTKEGPGWRRRPLLLNHLSAYSLQHPQQVKDSLNQCLNLGTKYQTEHFPSRSTLGLCLQKMQTLVTLRSTELTQNQLVWL